MINASDLLASEGDYEQDAQDLLAVDLDKLVDAVLILGQLDPTEIDTSSMLPRWTDAQRELISRARDVLSEWQDS